MKQLPMIVLIGVLFCMVACAKDGSSEPITSDGDNEAISESSEDGDSVSPTDNENETETDSENPYAPAMITYSENWCTDSPGVYSESILHLVAPGSCCCGLAPEPAHNLFLLVDVGYDSGYALFQTHQPYTAVPKAENGSARGFWANWFTPEGTYVACLQGTVTVASLSDSGVSVHYKLQCENGRTLEGDWQDPARCGPGCKGNGTHDK